MKWHANETCPNSVSAQSLTYIYILIHLGTTRWWFWSDFGKIDKNCYKPPYLGKNNESRLPGWKSSGWKYSWNFMKKCPNNSSYFIKIHDTSWNFHESSWRFPIVTECAWNFNEQVAVDKKEMKMSMALLKQAKRKTKSLPDLLPEHYWFGPYHAYSLELTMIIKLGHTIWSNSPNYCITCFRLKTCGLWAHLH